MMATTLTTKVVAQATNVSMSI
jgi:hypothetical protein